MLHMNIHTTNACIHAAIRDGGLGILELRSAIPAILLKRLVAIRENDNDSTGQRLTYTDSLERLMIKLNDWSGAVGYKQK